MKPLIVSFFAVLLGYSLFVDKDKEVKLSPPPISKYTSPEALNGTYPVDSIEFYANKTMNNLFIY